MASSDNNHPTEIQFAQVAAVLGPDNSHFETLISHLMSAANDQRSQAKTLFNLCKQNHPDTLVLKLSQLLHSSPHAEARAMSAVLLRRILTIASDDESQSQTLYHSLAPATQLTLKSTLLESTLTEALNSGEETTTQEALELLIELAGTKPSFLRKQIAEVVGLMLQIPEAETLEEGTKHLAVEFVITLAEARERAPGMIRKLPQFIKRLFEIPVKMLLDVEDDPTWYSAEVEHEDAGKTSNYSVGQECLDRLSISLGGNTIVPVVSEILLVYLAAPEWQKHYATLIAVAQIAEGCSKYNPNSPAPVDYGNHPSQKLMREAQDDETDFASLGPNADIDESDDERIGIKTSVLEEKATACNMLCCYADELKEGFFPWIDQVAPTLVPLLKFYFHEEVRKAAVSAMAELLRSAKLAVEKGQSQGRNESYVNYARCFSQGLYGPGFHTKFSPVVLPMTGGSDAINIGH
ncbi:hypothetical protein L6452_09648 [Arctium lappa]|uniref:Uncharacterized protein n=1 Tax=Arctium lappa TaxID=4217 RepID=A0ACB9DKY8_ARCLA|nr:hypothetical protein L6452_09648 [Arctium lappa]